MALDAISRAYSSLVYINVRKAQHEKEKRSQDANTKFPQGYGMLTNLPSVRFSWQQNAWEGQSGKSMTLNNIGNRGPHNITSPAQIKIRTQAFGRAESPATTIPKFRQTDQGFRANSMKDELVSPARTSAAITLLRKVVLALEKYPEAVCNDGSPAAYYHQGGFPKSRDWIIHLEVRYAPDVHSAASVNDLSASNLESQDTR